MGDAVDHLHLQADRAGGLDGLVAQERLGLHGQHLGDGVGVVGEVRPGARTHLHHPARQPGEHLHAVIRHAGAVVHGHEPGEDPGEDRMADTGGHGVEYASTRRPRTGRGRQADSGGRQAGSMVTRAW